MFEDEKFDAITFEDGETVSFIHDNETEDYYCNGGETFTEEEYWNWEAASAAFDEYERRNEVNELL